MAAIVQAQAPSAPPERVSNAEATAYVEQQAAVNMEYVSDVADILTEAKNAVRRAKSLGECKRIRKMTREKTKLIGQFVQMEDYM